MEYILTAILVIYLASKLIKFLFKLFISRKFSKFTGGASWDDFVNNAKKNQEGGSAYRNNNNKSSQSREGDITVTTISDNDKKVSDKVGDYVDFEEVK